MFFKPYYIKLTVVFPDRGKELVHGWLSRYGAVAFPGPDDPIAAPITQAEPEGA